eukprot:CAMPEP_0181513908 /NCGR_PEP_ID=MMETSP1110-20121109/62748_1 /TAXON_ID=174948 /ORGANISM="Symbiodinium sp., Strain CCMP421" /LENGTH=50 /DNA_ID=CAMNT_0023643803 /DNA_START=132 /DNA_END=280 /DNA_ORIENTATION=-
MPPPPPPPPPSSFLLTWSATSLPAPAPAAPPRSPAILQFMLQSSFSMVST